MIHLYFICVIIQLCQYFTELGLLVFREGCRESDGQSNDHVAFAGLARHTFADNNDLLVRFQYACWQFVVDLPTV